MCFSATASFTVGAGLIVPGILALKKTDNPGMKPLACTPLIFSGHQIAEGCLWLSLDNPAYASWYNPALYTYSFISQPFWPFWVPFIMWMMEPEKARKKILGVMLIIGTALAFYLLYCVANYGISATAECGHIRYHRDFPGIFIIRPLYVLTVAFAPFLSTLRYSKLLAYSMLGSLLVAYFFYRNYTISVWCFFAAILSLIIFLVIYGNKKDRAFQEAGSPDPITANT